MAGFIIFLLVAWAVLSVVGFIVKGMLWLGLIGLILFAITAVVAWSKAKSST